ncbi:MAG: ribonuclease [Dechloromonas agitata]|uniref:Ribonuclease n=1 Tax=Dechloromonas agitata TaxID=73030 RepID=A0A930FYU4_9RHOO|nr:ribonuclease domain-containing protein [Dechloromonas agitata]MBF1164431.1 ribonuclease [Dechloromonas agitata]
MPFWLRFLLVLWLAVGSAFALSPDQAASDTVTVAELPREARQTLALIKEGGPFPYDRDGIIFGNFEKRLPSQPRGYYREYTVKSPWRRDRGPRRIVAGKQGEYFYTEDHYRSFRRIIESKQP